MFKLVNGKMVLVADGAKSEGDGLGGLANKNSGGGAGEGGGAGADNGTPLLRLTSDQLSAAGETARSMGAEAERARASNIDAAAAPFADDAEVVRMRDAARNGGVTVEDFRASLLSHVAAKNKPAVSKGKPADGGNGTGSGTGSGADVQVGADRRAVGTQLAFLARLAPACVAAISGGAGSTVSAATIDSISTKLGFESAADARRAFGDLSAGDMRRASLMSLATAGMERKHTREQIADMSMGDFMNAVHTTSDFPKLFANAANKVLQAQQQLNRGVWAEVCATQSVNDFKSVNILNLSSVGNLKEIPEGGPREQLTADERQEVFPGVKTFGGQIEVTYQMIRNDDLNGLAQLLTSVEQRGAILPDKLFHLALALNAGAGPNLADGNPLFHSSRNNISTAAALSADNLKLDWTAHAAVQSFGPDKEPLDLEPAIVLVPYSLKWTLEDIAYQERLGANTQTNTLRGRFKPLGSKRLTGTRRYLFVDPRIMPVFTMYALDGQFAPKMDSVPQLDMLKQIYNVTIPGIGIGVANPEGALTNAGA